MSRCCTLLYSSAIRTKGETLARRLVVQNLRQASTLQDSGVDPSTLSLEVLRSIKKDLVEADVNNDGRVDFEELKMVLGKYQNRLFSSSEIDKVGELFFVGTSGQGVKHSTFLRGLQHAAHQNPAHENPLHLESLSDQRCWVDRAAPSDQEVATAAMESHNALYNVQEEFDQLLLKYIEEKSAEEDEDWEQVS